MLEASAGTGKTYTIAALAARYVAEGRATLGQLLLVTFGRMATSELRARVRERLVDHRTRPGGSDRGPGPRSDRVHRPGPPSARRRPPTGSTAPLPGRAAADHRARRRTRRSYGRVRRALADFDAATIATTHEFCLQMLDGLGVLGDREPERRIVEQLTDLVHEVAGDVYLARYAETAPR